MVVGAGGVGDRLTLLVGFKGEFLCLLHGDLLAGNLVVDGRQVLLRQVFAVVDPSVHLDVLLFSHLVLHLWTGRKDGGLGQSQTE